jgi:hypothetical protein
MKTILLKKALPFFVFALGIGGALATMSMQDAGVAGNSITGYAHNPQTGLCNVPVSCSTVPGPVCRVSYPAGNQAFSDPMTCLNPVWKP